jgi:hypothetical protein
VHRLGSMLARVKLKGIDGGPHKRWSMWFNSMVREKPYQGLTSPGGPERSGRPERDWVTGAAWLSSARAVRCWVKSRNERNPYRLLLPGQAEDSGGTAGDKPEEGGDDVKSSWPLCPGLHTCYNGEYRAKTGNAARPSEPQKTRLSSDWSLKPDSMKVESLVIAHQHGAVNTVPGLVHTARHTTRVGGTRSRQPNLSQGGRRRRYA